MLRGIGVAVVLGLLAGPAEADALRYASPSGDSADSCDTPAQACDLHTAISGSGANMPSSGEEVIVLPGSYSLSVEVPEGASNMNVHGALDQPRPVINMSGLARFSWPNGTLSYLHLESTSISEALNLGGGTAERLLIRGASSDDDTPVCSCHGGVLRDSVIIATGDSPALGLDSNGGSSSGTYRNVTAYATNPAVAAMLFSNIGVSGNRQITAFNTIVLNGAGGTDVTVDGPGSTLTFSHSNYRGTSLTDGGVIGDVSGDTHQTALPLFANAATGDFNELSGSPTINAGVTDPLNGAVDFAGNPRTVGASTDIGAYEFSPPPTPPAGSTPSGLPTFTLDGRKVRINRKGKGRLAFSCTSPAPDRCDVLATLTTGGAAKKRSVGRISGTVPGGSSGKLTVKVSKRGRKALARKRKLRTTVSGSVTGAAGLSATLAAALALKKKS
jgi:hypothetical protein